MLIPERTVDMWAAMAVRSYLPDALVWGPTPWDQSRLEPWDVSVGTPLGKVLVIENKGVQDDGSVLIDRRQLRKMCQLESAAKNSGLVGGGNLALYGLPRVVHHSFFSSDMHQSLRAADRQLLQSLFPQDQLMFRPSALRSLIDAAVAGNPLPNYVSHVDQVVAGCRIVFSQRAGGFGRLRLFQVLHGIPRCTWGARIRKRRSDASTKTDPSDTNLELVYRELQAVIESEQNDSESGSTPPQLLRWPMA